MLQKKKKNPLIAFGSPLPGFEEYKIRDKKKLAWKSILRWILEDEGYETDLLETAYNKKIYSRLLAALPATERTAQKIMGTSDIRVAKNYIAEMALLPNTEWILPETFARGLRSAKENLRDKWGIEIKYGQREFAANDVVPLDDGEEYYSPLEERFIKAIKNAFPTHRWKINEKYVVRHHPYKGKVVYPDLMCEGLGLWMELLGHKYHSDRHIFTIDRQRARIAQLEGYYYLPFSGEEISVSDGIENALAFIDIFTKKIGRGD